MAFADWPRRWLRQEQAEFSRLALAFALSMAVHLLLVGTYYTGKKFGWWQYLSASPFGKSARMITELFKKKEEPPKPLEPEAYPTLFLDVSPAQETKEPPKDALYYSARNSQAANPDEVEQESNTPKITGQQENVPKTEDVPRERPQPPQPIVKSAQPDKEDLPEEKAKPAATPGDLAMGKPEPEPKKDPGTAKKTRPRTVKEAKERQTPSQIPGEKMKQEGGVRRRLEIGSLDSKASPFGAYDTMLVEAISQRWFSLLDQRDFASDSRGKVIIHFALHQDGRVTDVRVAENSAGDVLGLICQKAVLDPAPYPEWPPEMRRLAGSRRSIQFTFYYN